MLIHDILCFTLSEMNHMIANKNYKNLLQIKNELVVIDADIVPLWAITCLFLRLED